MSELIRQEERKQRWDEINAYGRQRAAELGIAEEDVARIVKESREEQRLSQLAPKNPLER